MAGWNTPARNAAINKRLGDQRARRSIFPVSRSRHPDALSKDFLRLNLYLTKDGDYVTIWHGLLEPMFAEAELTEGRLAMVEKPADLDILNSYNEPLFRGYIDSADAAACIFKALRVARTGRYALPQVLTAGTDNRLCCDWIQEVGQGS